MIGGVTRCMWGPPSPYRQALNKSASMTLHKRRISRPSKEKKIFCFELVIYLYLKDGVLGTIFQWKVNERCVPFLPKMENKRLRTPPPPPVKGLDLGGGASPCNVLFSSPEASFAGTETLQTETFVVVGSLRFSLSPIPTFVALILSAKLFRVTRQTAL